MNSWRMTWPVKICVFVVLFLTIIAVLAPWITPYHFDAQNVLDSYASPSMQHWFGTDALGRDLLTRLMYGCRISLSIAFLTAFSSLIIGVVYGTISGYVGGWVDVAMMRFVDILYTLPSLIVTILIMLIFGRDLTGIFIALTITGWLGTARLMRGQILSWKNRPFVEAARSLGMPHLRIIALHLIPNCIAPIIVELSYQIPTNILAEAFLSFLGVGIRPPTPSWGILAEEGWRSLRIYPHLTLFPGALIFITMLSFNVLGDDLRDRLDPFLKGK
ncbi:MAG: ABC transporter permease [Bdellovibrionota bacterium]